MKQTMIIMMIIIIILLLSFFMSKTNALNKEKNSSFECGFDPYLMCRLPFSLRFFKVALIFLIFDIEIILILPIPFINNIMNPIFIWSTIFILLIILFGLIYEWNQGSLNWMK